MNTNEIAGSSLNEIPILNLVPEKFQGWVLVLVWLAPFVTRGAHSLYQGTGIVGAVKGVLFGTNVPKPAAKP